MLFRSPAVVRESLVRLRHTMGILTLLHRAASIGRGIEKLTCELVDHRLFRAVAGKVHEPTERERRPSLRAHFDRYLVVTASHAAALDFQRRFHVVHRFFEDLEIGRASCRDRV